LAILSIVYGAGLLLTQKKGLVKLGVLPKISIYAIVFDLGVAENNRQKAASPAQGGLVPQ
jgi:hypothetical protein